MKNILTQLHLFIKDVLEESNINVNELSAVSVSKGPGSYTGLRIGNCLKYVFR